MAKKKNKFGKFGNPQKRIAMQKEKAKKNSHLRLAKQGFIQATNTPTFGQMATRRGDNCWVISQQFDVNAALDYLDKIDPSITKSFSEGKLATAWEVKNLIKLGRADELPDNRFEVRFDGKLAFKGRWWGMKGSEANKVYESFRPLNFGDDDLVICDVCCL